jgi:phosphatidylethanolamine-binding protein (PEBP) family uncharacterized protein
MRRRTAVAAVAVAAALLVAPACATGDGRDMTSPSPGATAPTTTDPGAIDGASTLPLFTLTSPVLVEGQPMPATYTCDGEGVAPVLTWANPPSAAEFALVLIDEDARGIIHWIVGAIPAGETQLDPANLPSGAVDLLYMPPCPPPGDPPHRYVFTLYALTSPVEIDRTMLPSEALELIQASPAQVAQLAAIYQR